jgi:hypothetical protein
MTGYPSTLWLVINEGVFLCCASRPLLCSTDPQITTDRPMLEGPSMALSHTSKICCTSNQLCRWSFKRRFSHLSRPVFQLMTSPSFQPLMMAHLHIILRHTAPLCSFGKRACWCCFESKLSGGIPSLHASRTQITN